MCSCMYDLANVLCVRGWGVAVQMEALRNASVTEYVPDWWSASEGYAEYDDLPNHETLFYVEDATAAAAVDAMTVFLDGSV